MLTHTFSPIQKYEITVHAKMPENIAELGLGFCREKLTLITSILADNDSRDSCMHKDPDGWSNNALFLRCYCPAIS